MDPYFNPDTFDPEIPCRSCGKHQGECAHDGICCRHCTHHDGQVLP